MSEASDANVMVDGRIAFLAAIPAFAVSDIRRAAAFFSEQLGFETLLAQNDYGIVKRDQIEIHLWAAVGPPSSGAEPHLAGSTSCRIEVTGIGLLYQQCRERGVVHPNSRLHDEPWGTREFAVQDPDGNLVTFYQPVTAAHAPAEPGSH